MKEKHKKKLNSIESELSKHILVGQEQNNLLQILKLNEEKLKLDLKNLETQKTELEVEITYNLQEISNLKNKYDQETTALSQNLKKCKNLIEKKLIFNDENNELFNSFTSSKKFINNVKSIKNRINFQILFNRPKPKNGSAD
jgi:hypothetical protein